MVQGYYTLDEAAKILGMSTENLSHIAQKRTSARTLSEKVSSTSATIRPGGVLAWAALDALPSHARRTSIAQGSVQRDYPISYVPWPNSFFQIPFRTRSVQAPKGWSVVR